MKKEELDNQKRRYIVMDVVFYGSSLNYDQGTGNYQELKKITKWDGKQYILVSRYALRCSILHWANKLYPDKWKLAGKDQFVKKEGGVVHPDAELIKEKTVLNFPEFDLFGFMIAEEKGEVGITRVSPVKISHAFSLTPYNYDSHFMANLDIMRRAGGKGSNPVTIEEKKDFYVYNVVVDVDRVGRYLKEEHGLEDVGDIDKTCERNERIGQLVETIFQLKREIKGRMEDLSPWLVICGLYSNGKYETYADKIELAKHHIYKIITKKKETKDNEGRVIAEIEHETVEKDAPKFVIGDIDSKISKIATKDEILNQISKLLEGKDLSSPILVYKKQFIETEPVFERLNLGGKG